MIVYVYRHLITGEFHFYEEQVYADRLADLTFVGTTHMPLGSGT